MKHSFKFQCRVVYKVFHQCCHISQGPIEEERKRSVTTLNSGDPGQTDDLDLDDSDHDETSDLSSTNSGTESELMETEATPATS